MSPTGLARHLSVRTRRPAWLGHYPGPGFWQPWHMSLLAHGGIVATSRAPSFMEPLYGTHTLKSRAAQHLLEFEQRTGLGHLEPETRCTRDLLLDLLQTSVEAVDLADLWTDLPGHVARHLNAHERPHLETAARALRAFADGLAIGPDVKDELFPRTVADADGYARLARAMLFAAIIPASPLQLTLYCPRSQYAPNSGLSVNVYATLGFLAAYGPEPEREVTLGIGVATAERVRVQGGTLDLPVLNTLPVFSTLFAPEPRLSGALRDPGRAAILYLQ